MSGRLLYSDLVNSPDQVTVKFRFQINSTSDPDALLPYKSGVTNVTRAGAGDFDVTFAQKYPVFLGLTGTVMGDSGATLGLVVQSAVTDYNSSTGVLTVYTVDTYTDPTPAAADPTDDDWVYVEATFCKNSQLAPSGSI